MISGLPGIITPGILEAHQAIHDGNGYYVGITFAGVLTTVTKDFFIKVGSGKALHSYFHAAAQGNYSIQIYETPTTSADGTGLTARNLNRVSGNTTNATFFHTPTVSAAGTALTDAMVCPGGVGPKSAGGIGYAMHGEWILKKSTNYLVRITNTTAGTIDMSASLTYYEV